MKTKKALTLGLIGPTKSGKTATLSFLTRNAVDIQNISNSDESRTKITIEYHFDPDYEGDMFLENIWYFPVEFMGSQSRTVDKYNENIDNDMVGKQILTKVFNMKKLNADQNVQEYVTNIIDGLCNKTIDLDTLKKLISTENIDDYISRIIIKVEPEDSFKQYIIKNNLDLRIRDTRGLLDIVITEDDGKKNLRSTKSITELGLESMDGILFYCNDSYPNITKTLYEDILSKLLKSIPVFLVSKDNVFKQAIKVEIKDYEKKIDIENISNFIKSIQKNQVDMYEDLDNNYDKTFELLSNFEITKKIDDKWDFVEPYYDVKKVEFVLPRIKSLQDNIHSDYKLLKISTISMISIILDNIIELHSTMNYLFENENNKFYDVLTKVLHSDMIKQQIVDDFEKFNNGPYGTDSPKYTRPVSKEYSTDRLNNEVIDSNIELQGPYGGITTRNNGRLKYYLTAVLGVTSSNWMFKIIDNLKVDNMFKAQGLSDEEAQILTKKLLRYVYYRRYIDKKASIDGYLITDREKVIEDVAEIRNMAMYDKILSTDAFVTVITKSLQEFANIMKEMNNVADVYIRDENKK